ncbi:hypothetical protein HZZ02_16720 [Streptococcus danieliae]|nr:hypothetical protein [Streptococcus danieliae]
MRRARGWRRLRGKSPRLSPFYPDGDDDGADALRRAQYCAETTRFIDEEQATTRLALMRSILSAAFDTTLGADEMGDLERAVDALPLWRAPDRLS